ncbi:MAG: AMP-binding protein [Hyphomicrobium sp.]|nr:AMP-binding protein [Hyphomicrobium sp.]
MKLSGASYDELYGNFRWEVPARFNIAHAICDRHAAATPDAPALIHEAADGSVNVWTFARIRESADRLAHALAALGVGRGAIVAIHLSQCPENLITHVAVHKLGAVAMPLFALFGPDAVRFRLEDSGAAVFVTADDNMERVAAGLIDIPTLHHIISIDGPGPLGVKGFWELAASASSSSVATDTSPDDPAYLMYTSGTTGNPKGVLHAQRVLLGHLPGVMVPHNLFPQAGDRFWTPADWAWAGGIFDVLLPSLYFGVPVVAQRLAKFEPDAAFALMARHGVRNIFMPPTALRMLQAVPNPRAHYDYNLRSLASGGEPMGADIINWGHETFGLTLSEFYGQTEVNLVVGNCPPVFPAKPGSMGRPIPGHIVEIVDRDGNVLPAGETGIVAVRRPDPVMFLEYWKQPEATADKFRGEWCLLGDIAAKDQEGYFWFQGRDNDIIKSAGYRIGPGEVEECLQKHPAVALAGVIGTPDPLRGEAVTAFIVTRPEYAAGPELANEIQAFVKERLAAHEYPRRVHFIAEMPMTVTGKIRRVDLRQMADKL